MPLPFKEHCKLVLEIPSVTDPTYKPILYLCKLTVPTELTVHAGAGVAGRGEQHG